MPPSDQANVLGSVGVALLLVAFFLNLFRLLRTESPAYLLLNCTGALLACISSWLIGFVPFVVLEGTWALVAGLALARALRPAQRTPSDPPR